MKSDFAHVDQGFMEYQKRLRFIEYIKKNFIENDLGCLFYKSFRVDNYDSLDLIHFVEFQDSESSSKYYEQFRYLDIGICQYTFDYQGRPYLIFEDSYMVYQFNLLENRTEMNDLNNCLMKKKLSLQEQVVALIAKLNGEDVPERIGNC